MTAYTNESLPSTSWPSASGVGVLLLEDTYALALEDGTGGFSLEAGVPDGVAAVPTTTWANLSNP